MTRVEYKSHDEFEEANRRYKEYEQERYEYERKKGINSSVSRREPSTSKYRDDLHDTEYVKRGNNRREANQPKYNDVPLEDHTVDLQRPNGHTNSNSRRDNSTPKYKDEPYTDNPNPKVEQTKRPSNLKDTSYYDDKANRSMASSKAGSIRKKEIHFRDEVEVRS